MLAVPLIATLFHHGAFTGRRRLPDAQRPGRLQRRPDRLILVKVLAPGFYARQNIRTPVKIALISLAATQAMNLAFIGWLQHAGLALSIGLAACLNAALLYRGLRRHEHLCAAAGLGLFSLKLLAALAVMGGALVVRMGTAAVAAEGLLDRACCTFPGWSPWRGAISLHYGFSASACGDFKRSAAA
jgi:putative peptidoglycan lipid II flippase